MIEVSGVDTSSVALDMTNFATFIASANEGSDRAAGQSQTETDRSAAGRLGLVVTRDGGIPMPSHAYPGDRPDVTQFPTMIELAARYRSVTGAGGHPGERR